MASSELIVAIIALAISLFAFLTAGLQALQQYFASATGYASCSENVVGKWHRFTRRRMRWSEFRISVEFAVPVIFVAQPTNRSGPMGMDDGRSEDTKIYYMDGSTESIRDTFTYTQKQFDDDLRRRNLSTANNELATWLDLLMALQRMERESRKWHDSIYQNYPPYYIRDHPIGDMPNDSQYYRSHTQSLQPAHTLAVGLQRKTKSWDSMPAGVKKPYAITTIGHLIEIVAMLGIYWKKFDRGAQVFYAQGNGFHIHGRHVDNLGIVFTFQKTGPTWFENHRIVPNEMVKELCFGLVPTIFRSHTEQTRIYSDEAKDNKTLQLATLADIAETLVVFGCNITTVGYFRQSSKSPRYGHIFPIAFEMLGMIGVIFHVENTAFRMLPNPTMFAWDTRSFSLHDILFAFTSALQEGSKVDVKQKRVPAILGIATEVNNQFREGGQRQGTSNQAACYSYETIRQLRAALTECDRYLVTPDARPLVECVFRVHIEVVLEFLNDGYRGGDGQGTSFAANSAPGSPHENRGSTSPLATYKGEELPQQPRLADLDSASPNERHFILAEMYSQHVRDKVGQTVRKLRRDALEETIDDVWCTLVFRMLFWLLLHDFHNNDVQLPKSGLFGDRLPVYIS
ncbi:hypothetical protein V2A60_001314 [Cordyceps javanica]